MAHFQLINSETRDLTREIAVEFSTMAASTSERDLKPKRLDYLKARVLGGTAISFSWARAKVVDTGAVYRVNGHHSSAVLAQLDGNFPEGLKVHIDDYVVPHLESLALLFRQFDSRVSARTIDDISGAHQGLVTALAGVSRAAGRAAITGAAWYKKQIMGDAISTGDDVYTLFFVPTLHPYIEMMGRIHSGKTPEFSAPVLGAVYGTWESDAKEAETFWYDVARQGGGNDQDHPATVLDAWLMKGLKAVDRQKPKQKEVYNACALAWNAYRNHRSLGKIAEYVPAKGVPELD